MSVSKNRILEKSDVQYFLTVMGFLTAFFAPWTASWMRLPLQLKMAEAIAFGFLYFWVLKLLITNRVYLPPGSFPMLSLIGISLLSLIMSPVPIVLISSSFRGVLEASQRFDLVNAVKIPSSALTFLLPLIGLWLGFTLPGIVALILLARVGALAVFVVMNLRLVPKLKRYSGSFSLFPRLFSFGGWVTVSSIVGPILVYLDRFLIGSLLTMTAVAYYTAPYEAVTRLWIIPTSLIMALFPAFSALEGIGDRQRLGMLFARSVKYVLLVLGPIVLLLVLFAKEILQIWLGADFSTQSRLVLQILALGVLINSLAHSPFALLQGVGRPDIPAKFHLLELPIYIGLALLLISYWGIAGAAAAWTLRVSLDAFLLFLASFKVCSLSVSLIRDNGLTLAGVSLALFGGFAYGLKTLTGMFSLPAQLALFAILFGIFALLAWKNILDASDRKTVLRVIKLRQKSESAS